MPSLREAQLRHAIYYTSVLREADNLFESGSNHIKVGVTMLDHEWENIRIGQGWSAANSLNSDIAAELCDDYPDAGAYCLDMRLPPQTRISWLENALSAAHKLGRLDSQALHLGNLGNAHLDLEQYNQAVQSYSEALGIHRARGDRRGESTMLNNLGNAYTRLDEIPKALELYQLASSIDREIGDRNGEGNDLGNLGTAYLLLGETKRAIEYFQQHLVIMRETGNLRGESAALGNLGIASKQMGNLREAILYYEQQLAIVQEIGDHQGEALTSWNLSLAYEAKGDLSKAFTFLNVYRNYQREIGLAIGEEDAARISRVRDHFESTNYRPRIRERNA